MTTRMKKILAAMLSITMLANSNILLISADNETEQSTSSISLQPLDVNDRELFTSPESDYDFNYPHLTNNYSENETEEIILNVKDYQRSKAKRNSNSSETITYDEGSCGNNAAYTFSNGILTISGKGAIDDYEGYSDAPWVAYRDTIHTIEINDEITQIGKFAFAGFTNLTTIKSFAINNGEKIYNSDINKLTPNIKEINIWAFMDCKSLRTIKICSEQIRQQAFFGCEKLETAVLENGVKNIEYSIFIYCNKIEQITIPASLEYMWNNAFVNMNSLAYITVDKDNANYSNDENGILYNKNKTDLIFIPESSNWMNNDDNNSKYTDFSDNNYLVINNCIYDFVPDEYSNGTFVTNNLTNSKGKKADIKAVRLIENKEYNDILNITLGRDIELYPKTFDKTKWYKTNKNNTMVIYESLSPTSSTYSRLYRYNSTSNDVNISYYDVVEGNAFENKKGINIIIDSNNAPKIDHKAFVDAAISSISVDGKELSYSDFTFDKDEIILTYENVGTGAFTKGAGIFKDEESLKAQLTLAILKSSPTMSIYEKSFCKDLIKKMGWKELAEKDPYEAVYAIQKWITSNSFYTGWLAKSGYFDKVVYSFDNENYIDYLDMSAHTFGNIATGYIVCGGYSSTLQDIINNLEVNTLKSIGLGSPTHAFAMIGVNEKASQSDKDMIWYYTEPQGAAYLKGQKNFGAESESYYGYRKKDLHLGKIKETLEKNNIYYSYVNENGETIIVNDNNESGVLSETDYNFPNKNNINVVIHKVISNPDHDVNVSLSLPENISACEYRTKEVSQGYKLYTDAENKLDSFSVIINPCNYKHYKNYINFKDILKHPNIVYGNVYKVTDEYNLYLYGVFNGHTVTFTISDEDQLQLNKKIYYKINDYAGIGNIAIRANNWGEFYNYSRNNNTNMTDYKEIIKYTDFSGYVSLAGVDVFDFDDPDVGTYYGTTPVTEFGEKINVGYYITVTKDHETKEKYIDIKTYSVGDLNLNGSIDKEDLIILRRYLLCNYQFIQTGSDGDLTFNANNITVNGDVAANGTMNILGGVAHINGTLTARHLNDAVGGSNLNYKKVDDDEEAFPTEIINSTFSDENMMEWYFSNEDMKVYDFTTQTNPDTKINGKDLYPNRDMEEIKDTYSKNGYLKFHGGFNVTGNVKATYDISVDNAEQFKTSSVIYSEKGDISITSDKVTINGFIYAPNGKVTITSDDLNITGTIIAKELEIVSKGNLNFNIASLSIVGGAQLSEFQFMLADLNGDGRIDVFDSIILQRKYIN